MTFILNLYTVTLDFIYKISGPIIAIAVIGLIVLFRKDLGHFISRNISKIRGKVAGQEFEIDLNKLKESQSEAVKVALPKKLAEESNPEIEKLKKELEFEKIYSIIFGSQVDILKKIRDGNGSAGKGLVVFEFVHLKQFYPIYNSWSVDEFLGILLNNKLIVENQNIEKTSYQITQKGLDFLKYIEENNYNDRLF